MPVTGRREVGGEKRALAHCGIPYSIWSRSRRIMVWAKHSGNKPDFLLSFTFSFEDFIIAFFVAGPNNTLPIYIFALIRRGITPEINAIGAVVSIRSEGRREEAT